MVANTKTMAVVCKLQYRQKHAVTTLNRRSLAYF